MMSQSLSRTMAFAGLGAVALAGVVYAQSARLPNTDGMDQLLTEVRGLRAELSQASAASMRMQLLVARLSLQEQRIAALARQATEVQDHLAGATQEKNATSEQLTRLTAALQGASLPADQQREFEFELASSRSRLVEQAQRELRLQTQFDQISATIVSEQSRWTEFNARLDELERALPAPAAR
ncbi:MAG: hypothetical protein ND807_01885 [Vicinamibacterales bacterium]|nr:hypothetical protein [Vicinamibacterales bacterium]